MASIINEPIRNFLDHYLASVYNKLEADALLFNRRLPHAGLIGSQNEQAIGSLIRQVLPPQFGVEVDAIVIDRFGNTSRQADIVIYDATRPQFFRKVFPVELTYAVIEVKTSLASQDAISAIENLASVNRLNFCPELTMAWQHRTQTEKVRHSPPACFVFAFRTACASFETFARWFPFSFFNEGMPLETAGSGYPEIRVFRAAALDQGTVCMESSNGYIERQLAIAADTKSERIFNKTFAGRPVAIDPAKALFLFLLRLWFDLENHKLHPGFDIRSYASGVLGTVIRVPPEAIDDAIAPEA
jgi:hypothetical protein